MLSKNSSSTIANFHNRLTIFLVCLCIYSGIITTFYFKNPIRKFRYLSVHIRGQQDLAFEPLFHPKSRCSGCDRIRINAGDTKVSIIYVYRYSFKNEIFFWKIMNTYYIYLLIYYIKSFKT